MILYVNSCIRNESRTDRLARALLKTLGEYEEIRLAELEPMPLNKSALYKRTELIALQNYDDPMFDLAKQFASADRIVIAAPYWDGSFPAILKAYIENIFVTGIVSKYSEDGTPIGLCKATALYYVTTAGGPYIPDYSFGYISALAKTMFGIRECHLLYAENLDIFCNDPEVILDDAFKRYGLTDEKIS